jgi:hypothetical protein
MAAISISQVPSSNLISWILLLLIIGVDRWKNLELRSPSRSQSFLDFFFYLISSFSDQSSNSRHRDASSSRFSRLASDFLNLVFQFLDFEFGKSKTDLFQFNSSVLTSLIFLASLKLCEPSTWMLHAFSTTSLICDVIFAC